ncbi:hypothetical protein [Aliidiomarina celeris]|uniref:hypothetical protein n=1 Tax=Aliidiomarina celeris TaxID=2249428 RepID=UPI000DE94045|nr:hypothetical protein [Aliidiomarina celeris]
MSFTKAFIPAVLLSLSLIGCGDALEKSQDSARVNNQTEQLEEQLTVINELATNEERENALLRAIRSEVGGPTASSVEHCKLVGLGYRPCGGPDRFLLYSTETTNEQLLLGLVERYNNMVRQRVNESGMMGTCEVLPEPGLLLRGNVCVTASKAEM